MPNRLIGEQSPYLLQHAHNPVDWFPWGPEAFARARELDRPIFLSVGYATCHWCHVMERESFEHQGIAAYLNEHFVSIKVDREERPDVDHVYMAAVQAMTGQGGWPMSVFLTHEGQPFYGGTYFPPEGRWGRPGFRELLAGLSEAWTARRTDIVASAQSLTAHIQQAASPPSGDLPGPETLDQALADHRRSFDPRWGGFGGAPKFPRPHALSLLLRLHARRGESDILHMIEFTLDHMAQGGLRDHLGGGFARYSTDEHWLVPHFEKMLYDQALLATAYIEAFQVTHRERHASIAREVFGYVRRVLTDPGTGAFYSAEDADSEGEEGRFYIWTSAEIDELLGPGAGARFKAYYGVSERGNFEGRNILWTPEPDPEREFVLAGARATLLAEREQRPRPLLDDKILTSWNGLMISALARGAAALGEPAYAAAAARAADFILTRMQAGGRLLRRHRAGESAQPGFLEDYACLAQGLLDLHQADLDPRWLDESLRLARAMLELFWDEATGALRCAGKDGERLVAETIEIYDGAFPSGNSVATLLLLRLAQLSGTDDLRRAGERLLSSLGPTVRRHPEAFPYFLLAVDHQLGPRQEIVLAGRRGDPALAALQRVAAPRFLPRTIVTLRPEEAPARAYLCEDQRCRLPVSEPSELAALLETG